MSDQTQLSRVRLQLSGCYTFIIYNRSRLDDANTLVLASRILVYWLHTSGLEVLLLWHRGAISMSIDACWLRVPRQWRVISLVHRRYLEAGIVFMPWPSSQRFCAVIARRFAYLLHIRRA
jgi:hypothetical protein